MTTKSDSSFSSSGLNNVVTLQGSDNYAEFEFSLATWLVGRNLLRFTQELPSEYIDLEGKIPNPNYSKDCQQANLAYSVIVSKLSASICASLPAYLRNYTKPKPDSLWTHLKRSYSAQVGARQATLVQQLFRTDIPEAEDPLPVGFNQLMSIYHLFHYAFNL